MKIVCVGGGPAGLYTAIGARQAGVRDEIVVVERNPPGVTHGWGVVFWDDLLDDLHRTDAPSARELAAMATVWDGQAVRVNRRAPVFLGGSGYAVGRHELLALLTERAQALDVDVRFDTVATDDLVADADLVVAADGVSSGVRAAREDRFGTDVRLGEHRYIWLGTSHPFSTFTFGFVETEAGWIWCHAYRFRADCSTFIVECPEETWRGLGFDRVPVEECLRTLEGLFAHLLEGAPLLISSPAAGEPAPWVRFRRVENRHWSDGNVVLAGDAAHTTHFAIGSGTALALGDAMGLARHLAGGAPLDRALASYEAERRAALAPLQEEADRSTAWFATGLDELSGGDSADSAADDVALGWSLWQRRSDAPTWRWYLHLATQRSALRRLRASASSVRRSVRAQRRELADRAR